MCEELHGYLQHSACNVFTKLKDTEVSVWQEPSAHLGWKGELVEPEKDTGDEGLKGCVLLRHSQNDGQTSLTGASFSCFVSELTR